MDLPKEIAELRRQLEEKSRADELEKSRLRLALEEAKAEIKADEAYFDRLVEENEKLKADNRRLENGLGANHGHSSSHESPALSGSPANSVGPPDTAALRDYPSTIPKHTPTFVKADCAPGNRATSAGDDPVIQAAGPGNAGATFNDRARGASPLHGSAHAGQPERAAVQMLALPAPTSGPGRNAPGMMHLDEVRRLGADPDVAQLAGTLGTVLDALEPLRGLMPILLRLPAALSALEQLPKIQDMASRAAKLSTQNNEELRMVSRVVAVGSDLMDQSRKTVSQLQDRVAKEEAEGQARAAASNRATQRVEASVMALRREQKQSAQSALTMQNTLSDLQSAQLPSRLSDMEAEIVALKAKIAAQAQQQQQQQQQVAAAGRQVPAPAPPIAPFPGVAAAGRPPPMGGPRPPTVPHPADTAALGAASAPAAASAPQPTSAPASQPARLISARSSPLQQSLVAAPAFSVAPSQLSIPFQLLMPTVSSPQLAPPHSSAAPLLSKQAMSPSVEKQPHAAAAPSTEHAQPSGAAHEAAAKLRKAASAGSKPAIGAATLQPDATARRFAANSSAMSSGLQASAAPTSTLAESYGRPSAFSAPATAPSFSISLSNLDDTGQGRRARQEALELFICMDPVFVCGVCEVAFASEEGFLWHLNSTKHQDAVSLHASNASLSEETKVFRQHFAWHCELCNRDFQNSHAFSSHSTQSKPHASALAARMTELGLKQSKGRKVERHVPLLEGKALRDAWLNKHRGIQASGAAQQPLGDSSVRRVSIAAGFASSATPADQAADPTLLSPTAATAAAVALLPDLVREQSVEEGELVPGQPVPAVPAPAAAADGPQSGAGTVQPLISTSDAPQHAAVMASAAPASGAGGQASTAMQVAVDAALKASQQSASEGAERALEQQQTQDEAALLQQQARQAYALQRQLKEQKKQEQLQRLNKSLGFAFAAPHASQSTLASASLPPPQTLFPAPLDAAAAAALPQNYQTPVQRSHVAAAVVSTAAPAATGTLNLPPPIAAPAQPITAAPAAVAAPPAASNTSSAASLPASTVLQPPTAVAALSSAPVQPSAAAAAQALETAPHGQRVATPSSTSRTAASSARNSGANSISKTAEAFLNSLWWSQPQPPLAGRAPSLLGTVPTEPPVMSALPTLVPAKEQAGGKVQDVACPVAVSEASDAGPSQEAMSTAHASTQAPESSVQGGKQKQMQDLALPEAFTSAAFMSAPAAVEQVSRAQTAPPVPIAQPPADAPGGQVADAAQSMGVDTPAGGEGPLKLQVADKAPEPLTAGAVIVAATHAEALPLTRSGPADVQPEAKEATVTMKPAAATAAETHLLPEGASGMQADAPASASASASAMPAQTTQAAAVPQPTAAVDSGQIAMSSAGHEGSSRDISISFGGSSSHMSAQQTSEAVPASQQASIAAGALPREASQQPQLAAGKWVPKAGPVEPLRATQEAQLEGLPGRSGPQPVPIKRPPAPVPKPLTSLPDTMSPNVTARDGQCAEAQPSSEVQGGNGTPGTPTAAAAAASAQAPSSSAREESGRPADRIDLGEAAALHSASRSPQTPLYFRLTDVALGGDIPSQGRLPGDAADHGVMGSYAVRTPLSTTATVLRGTSAAARSGSLPASTKTGSAWSALPAKQRGAPGASPSGKQPPRKESLAKPAHAGLLANRKRSAEGIKGVERPVKRTVIRTGCRPPVQPASPVVAAANTAIGPTPPVSATTSSSGPKSSAASLVSDSIGTAPAQATVPEVAQSGASSMAVGASVVAGKQAAECAPARKEVPLVDQKAAPSAAAAASARLPERESAAPKLASVDIQKAAQSQAVNLGSDSSRWSKDKEAREDRPKESTGQGTAAKTSAVEKTCTKAAAAAKASGPPSHSTSGSKPDAQTRAGPERKRSSTPTRSTPKQSTQHSRGHTDRGRQTVGDHRAGPPARSSDRREPSKQPAGSSRGASLSRRPEPSSGRRSADPPRHPPSASRVSSRQGRSADRSDHHRSEARSKGVESHDSHRSSVRDVSTGRGHRVRERDRAFGPPASPTSPAGTPRGSGAPVAAAAVGSKRPRDEAGRNERRQQPSAKKPAAAVEKPAPSPAGEPAKELAPAQKPAAAADKPPAPVNKHAVEAEKPSPAAGKKPAQVGDRPAAAPVQGPPARNEKPPAVTQKPGEAARKPSIVPAKRPASVAADPPPVPAKKLAQTVGKLAPVPVPVPRPAAAAQKPAPVPANKPAAAAKNPVPAPVKKPAAAAQTAAHARIPSPSAKPAGAAAPGKPSSGAAAQPSRQIPAPIRAPAALSSGIPALSQAPSAARQQQPQQQKLSPPSKDRRVQLEAGIAEVRSKLKQMEQKHKSAQGRNSARVSAQAPPQQQSHGGRVITISSTSQPGPQVTVGGHPRLEGPPRGAPNFHHQHPVRSQSPHHFHHDPPTQMYGGGSGGPMLPPEQRHYREDRYGERPPQMHPPGLHMPPPVPSLSLPPYPPPFLPPLYADQPLPFPGGHPDQQPERAPMFEGSRASGNYEHYPPPHQQQEQEPLPPWHTDMFGPPDGFPYRPY